MDQTFYFCNLSLANSGLHNIELPFGRTTGRGSPYTWTSQRVRIFSLPGITILTKRPSIPLHWKVWVSPAAIEVTIAHLKDSKEKYLRKTRSLKIHQKKITLNTDIYSNHPPGIWIALIIQGVSNTDLSSVEPLRATVFSVGDADIVDFVRVAEVQSPPRFSLRFCVGAGLMTPNAIKITIDGPCR